MSPVIFSSLGKTSESSCSFFLCFANIFPTGAAHIVAIVDSEPLCLARQNEEAKKFSSSSMEPCWKRPHVKLYSDNGWGDDYVTKKDFAALKWINEVIII